MKFIILKSYYTSKDRIILKENIEKGSSICATLGYLLEIRTFNEEDDILILSENTDSVQIRPKAIYKNIKGYYIKEDNKRKYIKNKEDVEEIESYIKYFKDRLEGRYIKEGD